METASAHREPSSQTLWLLSALQLKGIGAAAVRKMVEMLRDRPNLTIHEAANYWRPTPLGTQDEVIAKGKAQKIVDACTSRSIYILSIADPEYPPRLRVIKDSPPIIYVKGSVGALSKTGCAVVGTRKASEVGLKLARRIAKVLAQNGFSTISGLALGIDAAAHAGAIDAMGVTVAILAHGLDTVAPNSNRKLAEEILERGGALVSEHEPGVPPRPAEFVRRNRIQSGMALCSIIVESGKEGGSIHQARFTKEQGRPILAVLPDLQNSRLDGFNSEGGEYLVHELGAIPLHKADELETFVNRFVDIERKNNVPSDGPQMSFPL